MLFSKTEEKYWSIKKTQVKKYYDDCAKEIIMI